MEIILKKYEKTTTYIFFKKNEKNPFSFRIQILYPLHNRTQRLLKNRNRQTKKGHTMTNAMLHNVVFVRSFCVLVKNTVANTVTKTVFSNSLSNSETNSKTNSKTKMREGERDSRFDERQDIVQEFGAGAVSGAASGAVTKEAYQDYHQDCRQDNPENTRLFTTSSFDIPSKPKQTSIPTLLTILTSVLPNTLKNIIQHTLLPRSPRNTLTQPLNWHTTLEKPGGSVELA